MPISRRNLLKTAAITGISGLLPFSTNVHAADITSSRLFVNLALDGGPDFRHLVVPPYSSDTSSYGYTFWKSRASAHNINNPDDQNALRSRYQDNYTPVSLGANNFAVLNSCGWLIQQINANNVAIINNTVLSTNRDHPHSMLIRESGVLSASAHDLERSGWGGRLAQQADKNIVSLSQNVKLFCNGEKPGELLKHNNERVIDMSDSRKASLMEFNLATADNNTDPWRKYWDDAKMKRTLKSYYAALGNELDANSPYYPLIQNEKILRKFGQGIDNRLVDYSIPSSIKAFYDWDDKSGNLSNTSFGTQIRNLYDSIVCQDVLGMGIASLEYVGWDSHKRTNEIESKFSDMFGLNKGFDILYKELAKVAPDTLDNMVILISGEFGRQLLANGTNGTDHGTGNSMLLIGKPVAGGCYGELFPHSELGGSNADPEHIFSEPNADIIGLTSMQQVYARMCDWLGPGTAEKVLPGWQNSILEKNVDLTNILPS